MNAFQLVAFITACGLATILCGLAVLVVWKLRPNIETRAGPGFLAAALGLFAIMAFGFGVGIVNHDPNAPVPSSQNGCQPGTYDNGSHDGGPTCFPWPVGTGR